MYSHGYQCYSFGRNGLYDKDKGEDKDKTKLPKKARLDWTPANVHDDK